MTTISARVPSTLCLLALASLTGIDRAAAQQFTNPSFESWGSPSSCAVNTPPDGWTNFNGSGAPGVDQGTHAICPHSIPAAAQQGGTYCRGWARASGGEGIAQTVTGFTPGRTYRIRYYYSGSNLYGGVDASSWHTFVDGADIDTAPLISPSQSSWTEHFVTFTATNTQHEIGFRGYGLNSGSLGLDNLAIDTIATAQPYGASCSVGSPLVLTSNAPTIGGSWALQGSGIEMGPLAVYWFGTSPVTPAFDLATIGADGCFAHVDANIGAYSASVNGGTSTYAVTIPSSAVLSGIELFVQMSAASTATALGITTSNGLVGILGQ